MLPGLLRLLFRRAISERLFFVLRFTGLALAVAIASGVFIYLDALGQSALNRSLAQAVPSDLNIAIRGRTASINAAEHSELISQVNGSIGESLSATISEPVWATKSSTLLFDRDEVAWPNARAFIATVGNLDGSANLIEGSWPVIGSNGLQVAVLAQDAAYLGVSTGSTLTLSNPSGAGPDFRVTVSGVFERSSTNREVWQALDEGLGANSQSFRFAPLIVSESGFTSEVPRLMPESDARYYWILPVKSDSIRAEDAESILADLDTQDALLRQDVLGFQRITRLDEVLSEHLASASISIGLMLAIGLLLAVASLSFAALVAARARELRETESGILRARGAASRQELLLMAGENLTLSVVALFVGPALALGVVAFSGRLPGLSALTGGSNLPATVTANAIWTAIAVTVVGAIVMILPSLTSSTTRVFRRLARPPQLTVIQRYYLDIPILGLGTVFLWQMSRGELRLASDALGARFSEQLALAMPAAIGIGVALTLLRFMPAAMAAIANGISHIQSALRISPAVTLALWTMARNPRSNFGLMLLVILALLISALVAILGQSLEMHATESARYLVGADARVSNMIVRSQSRLASELSQVRALDGIATVSTAARATGTVSGPAGTQAVTVLGLDPDTFASVAHWRPDFGVDTASDVVNAIGTDTPTGIPIPPDTVMLTALVKPDLRRGDAGLTARLRGASGRYYSLTIGTMIPRSITLAAMEQFPCEDVGFNQADEPLAPDEWCRIGVPLTAAQLDAGELSNLTLEYVGISLRPSEEQTRLGVGSAAIADISAVRADGSMVTLTRWEDIAANRTPGGGFGDLGARIDPASRSGNDGAVLTWSQPTAREIKGVRVGNQDATMKVIGGRWFRDNAELSVGDTLRIYMGRQEVEVEFRGFVDFFPTFGPARSPILIADLNSVRDVLAVADPTASDVINELWIDLDGADESTLDQVRERLSVALSGPPLVLRESVERAQFVADPLSVLGWNGFLTGGLISMIAITALAFAVNGWTTYKLRSLELAVLRSMGLTQRQWTWLIALEQTIPPLIAAALGTTLGLALSAVLLPYVAGEDAATVAPPMLVSVGWSTFGVACGALAIALAVSIGSVIAWTRQQQINIVLRAGGGIG